MTDSVQTVGTPEGVAFHLHPAGPLSRFLALVLDSLIALILFFVIALGLAFLQMTGTWIMTLSAFVLVTFGMVFCELLFDGASPGKRALGLQVVMADGRPVTVQASLIRNLLRFSDQLFVLGWILPLVTRGFRRLGDLAAGTLVVYRPDLTLRLHSRAEVAPLPPQRPLPPEAVWAAVEFGRRWDELGPSLRHELAELAGNLYRREPGETPEQTLRSVASWYRGHR